MQVQDGSQDEKSTSSGRLINTALALAAPREGFICYSLEQGLASSKWPLVLRGLVMKTLLKTPAICPTLIRNAARMNSEHTARN